MFQKTPSAITYVQSRQIFKRANWISWILEDHQLNHEQIWSSCVHNYKSYSTDKANVFAYIVASNSAIDENIIPSPNLHV